MEQIQKQEQTYSTNSSPKNQRKTVSDSVISDQKR